MHKPEWNSWKLNTGKGRQWWTYLGDQSDFATQAKAFVYNKKENPNSGDRVYRAQKAGSVAGVLPSQVPFPDDFKNGISRKAFHAAYKGIHFYKHLQTDEGHWPGDYGGPMFLLPGLVIASYVTETPFPPAHKALMKQYFLNHQNEDGGWGLHLEGKSTMFGTVLQYVALRLLGADRNATEISKARKWILDNGGATGIPSWGKFYLSVLGVYEWEGNNSLFPEMWLFPKWLPFHPSKYWCHARMVYLPMAYCFGNRFVGKRTGLVDELRQELYTQNYDSINWAKARNTCAGADLYYPQSLVLKGMNKLLNLYEQFHSSALRKKANAFCLEYINAEDEQTNYIDIGPVNQVMNSIAVFHAYGKDSVQFKKHVERWADYLWVAEDGMKMQGYNGSQFWDTAFATQAILEGGFEKYFPETVKKAFEFIDTSQVKEEVRDHKKFFRHDSVGGWPFSTAEHGWPITDCTAEGLKTTLLIQQDSRHKIQDTRIPDARLKQAADLLLSMQNDTGGWASYELTRAPEWLELLNPSEVFGNIMIDYSYTECTSACVQGLAEFKKHFPDYQSNEIDRSIQQGIRYILSQQRPDGSWYGSWAVCFTYGTWFAVEAIGMKARDEGRGEMQTAIERACDFLLSKQNEDGGWGESFESCIEKKYIPSTTSQVVNTSWAVMTLMAVEKLRIGSLKPAAIRAAVEKGVQLIINRQQENGDWEQESISGVFNHNCMISYTGYRNAFPIWALGRYLKTY
jgi:squalene/oxidosqualene cyclase-like protein